jgi:hypothetical protein
LLGFSASGVFALSFMADNASAAPLQTTVEPTISLSPNTSSVNLGAMKDEERLYEQYATFTTTTNSPSGYSLYLSAADDNTCLRHVSILMPAVPTDISCSTAPTNKRFTAGDPTVFSIINTFGFSADGGATFAALQPSSTPAKIKTTTAAATNNPTTVTFAAKIGNCQDPDCPELGGYSGSAVITAVANIPPAPTISSVSPASGNSAVPGATLTINGTNFATAYRVTVGGVDCANANIVSATQITCTIPAGTPNTAAAVEVTAWGGSATRAFTYAPIPTFSKIEFDAYPTRSVVTGNKITPGQVTITTGGGYATYANAVWFDLDEDGQRAANGSEDCTSIVGATTSIKCNAPPVLDANVTTTKSYTVCFTITGFTNQICKASAFTYYYDTTPPTLPSSVNTTTALQTSRQTHRSNVDIPIGIAGSGTLSSLNATYTTTLEFTSSTSGLNDTDNNGTSRKQISSTYVLSVKCEIQGQSGTSCTGRTFPSVGTYNITYTATDPAGNSASTTKTYTTYKENEYGLSQGETRTFTLANLENGTGYSVHNIQFGVWGGGGGSGNKTNSALQSGTGGAGGGAGFAGRNLSASSLPLSFTAVQIGAGGFGGSSNGADGGDGGGSVGTHDGYTYTAAGGGKGTGSTTGNGVNGSNGSGTVAPGGGTGNITGTGSTNILGAGGTAGGDRGGWNSLLSLPLGACSTGVAPGGGADGVYRTLVAGSNNGCTGGAGRISLYWRHYPAGYATDGSMP